MLKPEHLDMNGAPCIVKILIHSYNLTNQKYKKLFKEIPVDESMLCIDRMHGTEFLFRSFLPDLSAECLEDGMSLQFQLGCMSVFGKMSNVTAEQRFEIRRIHSGSQRWFKVAPYL